MAKKETEKEEINEIPVTEEAILSTPFGGHIVNICNHYGVTSKKIREQAFKWWLTEGVKEYGRIKGANSLKNHGRPNRDEVFKESGAIAKAKLIEFGAKI